jgi:hypothetical protein
MKNKIRLAILFLMCYCAKVQAQGLYNVWYEYGNGSFIKQSFSDATTLSTFLNSLPAGNVPAPNVLGYRAISKIYTPPPPPPNLKFYGFQNTIGNLTTYPTTKMVKPNSTFIHKSTNDFLSADTIQIALNYDKTGLTNARQLVFFYNSNPNKTFVPMTNFGKETPFQSIQNTSITNILNLRRPNGEIPNLAPTTLFNVGRVGNGFSDGIVFNLNTIDESNVFLTMFTFPSIITTNNERMRLALLDSNGNIIGDATNADVVNNSKLKSHDPNYEIVDPQCVLLSEAVGKKMHYKVHFQNIGEGNADSIKTFTELPIGYTIADIESLNDIKWSIGGIKFDSSSYDVKILRNTFNILRLEFRKKNAPMVLLGTLGLTDPINDVRTTGEFEFDLILKAPVFAPSNLTSFTDIYFDKNPSVKTNEATICIRECCTCPEQPLNDNTLACCKRKKLPRWKQWLFCKDCH